MEYNMKDFEEHDLRPLHLCIFSKLSGGKTGLYHNQVKVEFSLCEITGVIFYKMNL